MAGSTQDARGRVGIAFRLAEQSLYFAVAVALALGGAALFVSVVWVFPPAFAAGPRAAIIDLLDGLLLVFILAELIHTVRAVIEENVLRTEPFLIVGIVAAIRRMLLITADASRHLGLPTFRDLVVELAVLSGAVVLLGLTIYLVRHTSRSEPVPAHERERAEEGASDGER